MKPSLQMSSQMVATLAAVEEMVRECENCGDVLRAEIDLLRLKERILRPMEDTRWLVRDFIAPREAELATLEEQLSILRERVADLRRQCETPLPTPTLVWMETDSSQILALTA